MSDWEFLHDMQAEGYSAREIADAAAIGYSPDEAKHLNFGRKQKESASIKVDKSELQRADAEQIARALQAMEMLRQAGILTRPQFLACKSVILK